MHQIDQVLLLSDFILQNSIHIRVEVRVVVSSKSF